MGKPIDIPRLDDSPVSFSAGPPSRTVSLRIPVWCGALPGTESDLLVIEHQTSRIWRLIRDDGPVRRELFLDLEDQTLHQQQSGSDVPRISSEISQRIATVLPRSTKSKKRENVKTTVVERCGFRVTVYVTAERLRGGSLRSCNRRSITTAAV